MAATICVIVRTLTQNGSYTLVSFASSSSTSSSGTSSLPRSPPNKRQRYAHSTQHHDEFDGVSTGLSTEYHHHPPWNPSSLINSTTGLLKDTYQRIPGEWENEYRLKPTQNTDISNPSQYCRIRQVPGDGNCLFHSISVGLNYLVNRTHYDLSTNVMVSSSTDEDEYEYEDDDSPRSDSYSMSTRGNTMTTRRRRRRGPPTLEDLYVHSQYLRDECVKYLRSTLNDKRLFNYRFGTYHHPLYVQGREYINGRELIQAAAQQYNISDVEYCNTMAEDCVWGGGPEIVVLCNLLQRPIHVYELVTSTKSTIAPNAGRSDARSQSVSGSTGSSSSSSSSSSWTSQLLSHYPTSHSSLPPPSPAFVLRRMACFGSPKYDHKKAIHILSADSRFPDLRPGQQSSAGNHFLAVFPMDEHDHSGDDPASLERRQNRRKRIRGGDSSNDFDDMTWDSARIGGIDDFDSVAYSGLEPMNIVRRFVTQCAVWWQDLLR